MALGDFLQGRVEFAEWIDLLNDWMQRLLFKNIGSLLQLFAIRVDKDEEIFLLTLGGHFIQPTAGHTKQNLFKEGKLHPLGEVAIWHAF